MPNFDKALDYLRDRATDMSSMGRSFERPMKTAPKDDPYILGDRFVQVWMWNESTSPTVDNDADSTNHKTKEKLSDNDR